DFNLLQNANSSLGLLQIVIVALNGHELHTLAGIEERILFLDALADRHCDVVIAMDQKDRRAHFLCVPGWRRCTQEVCICENTADPLLPVGPFNVSAMFFPIADDRSDIRNAGHTDGTRVEIGRERSAGQSSVATIACTYDADALGICYPICNQFRD